MCEIFERKEEGYETSIAKAMDVENKLRELDWMEPEVLPNGEKRNGILSVYLENPLNLTTKERKKHTRIRIRTYYRPDNFYDPPEADATVWIELRKTTPDKVIKKRIKIKKTEVKSFLEGNFTTKNLIEGEPAIHDEIVEKIKLDKLLPHVCIGYNRSAYNSKDKKTRVTIDREIRYLSPPKNWGLLWMMDKIGEEKTAVIKVKYSETLPPEIQELITDLPTARSKVGRAMKFMEKGNQPGS